MEKCMSINKESFAMKWVKIERMSKGSSARVGYGNVVNRTNIINIVMGYFEMELYVK